MNVDNAKEILKKTITNLIEDKLSHFEIKENKDLDDLENIKSQMDKFSKVIDLVNERISNYKPEDVVTKETDKKRSSSSSRNTVETSVRPLKGSRTVTSIHSPNGKSLKKIKADVFIISEEDNAKGNLKINFLKVSLKSPKKTEINNGKKSLIINNFNKIINPHSSMPPSTGRAAINYGSKPPIKKNGAQIVENKNKLEFKDIKKIGTMRNINNLVEVKKENIRESSNNSK